jgi:translation initiation factor 2 beta subunit (eIF-2beta)/eIF-5
MSNTGIIITLAYPETIVMVSTEWFSPFLRFIGIGRKNYLRAGHGALVLINKQSGILEYYDFGRYITPISTGRVRGSDTDNELQFPINATIENNSIKNLKDILEFLATHPKLTHGNGKLVASVCNAIDYQKARTYITNIQNQYFVKYAVFSKNASNCARFVTDVLITSVTITKIKNKLLRSQWFTPSTIGNVLRADTENYVYEVSETGMISEFKGSQKSENIRCFLDRLKDYKPTIVGSLEPVRFNHLQERAQWLSGIGAGAWFELHDLGHNTQFQFKRISPYGIIDVHDKFVVHDASFDYNLDFEFTHYSNCKFFHVKQNGTIFRFDRI